MIHGGIFSGKMDNYDLFLRQKKKQKRSESSVKKTKGDGNFPKDSAKIRQIFQKPLPKNSWPTVWNIGGTVPKFTNLRYPPATPKSHDTCFQKPIDITLQNFKVYVTEKEYFMSNLTPITADRLQNLKENRQVINVNNYNIQVAKIDNSNYFNMLLATYIATFLSRISLQNLTDVNTPNVIKSIARFHVYYTA